MEKTENAMGTKKVMPLLISMSVPPMISMLIQALYNIVDSMYVARVSEDALTAVSIAFPLQNLIIAVSCGFWNRLKCLCGQSIGGKRRKSSKICGSPWIYMLRHTLAAVCAHGPVFDRTFPAGLYR